jgi:Retrotransposon gag protein
MFLTVYSNSHLTEYTYFIMAPTRAQTVLNAAGLVTARRDSTPIVDAFLSFSQRRASAQGAASSISQLMNRPYPTTPTPTPAGNLPHNDSDDEYPLGGNPPGDGGGDPDDDPEDPEDDENEGLGPQDLVFLRLSQAINNLVRNNRQSSGSGDSKVKVRELDTFDGTEPRKLRVFFVQCELNFQAKPKSFRTSRTKVNFAPSYLKGMALEWFEPDLLSDDLADRPDWMDDYPEFMLELQTNFGPHDPVGDAEMQLEQLYMRDGQRINKYVVEFQRLASQVRGWGDGALRRQFYNGLPARIKDEISRQGKPTTLPEYKTLAQTIDARYWERKGEVSRETKPSTSTPPAKQSASTSDRKEYSGGKSGTASAPSSTKLPDLTSKLGKDGKLTSEERQRRMEKKLCLFCGGHGHTARDCLKSTSRAAKGCASTVTPDAKPEVSEETKK